MNLKTPAVRKRNVLRRKSLWCWRPLYHHSRPLESCRRTWANFRQCRYLSPQRDPRTPRATKREIGRQALGCHGQVANRLIQGDLGWSSFEAREASSKLEYCARLRHMQEEYWAKRVFAYVHLRNVQTTSIQRLIGLGTTLKK